MTGGEPEVVVEEPGKREKGTERGETVVDDGRLKDEVISNNCEIVNATATTEILLVSLLFCFLIKGNKRADKRNIR